MTIPEDFKTRLKIAKSKINPIIVPTATAATSSVLNLKAVPIGCLLYTSDAADE